MLVWCIYIIWYIWICIFISMPLILGSVEALSLGRWNFSSALGLQGFSLPQELQGSGENISGDQIMRFYQIFRAVRAVVGTRDSSYLQVQLGLNQGGNM